MNELRNFSGVWKRTKLFEPIGELGPEEEQLKDVIWIQARSGDFIDIRYHAGATEYLKMKSFAGVTSFDGSSAHFTWKREFDFRTPGSPDIGLMRLLKGTATDPQQLEEDGVLPGDDYREIWDRLAGSNISNDCAIRLVKKGAGGEVVKRGLFLVVGDWFALTTSRALGGDRSNQEEAELKRIFDEFDEAPTTATSNYLWDYLCVVGSTTSWEIQYALHPELRKSSLLPNQVRHPELVSLFASLGPTSKATTGGDTKHTGQWEWDVVDGVIPAELCGGFSQNS